MKGKAVMEPDNEGRDAMTILAGHPYLDQKPHIYQRSGSVKWTVVYRDFSSMKQDPDFDTLEKAEAFAATLFKPPMTVWEYDLNEYDRFWREAAALASGHPAGHAPINAAAS
jgi:hypothetical protein